jgi:hypothetical protein
MEEFPDNFHRKNCSTIIETKEEEMSKICRQDFHKKIMSAVNGCEKDVTLTFPDKLWGQYRKKITEEILERFGEVQICTIQNKWAVTQCTTNKEDIPTNLKHIKINFISG